MLVVVTLADLPAATPTGRNVCVEIDERRPCWDPKQRPVPQKPYAGRCKNGRECVCAYFLVFASSWLVIAPLCPLGRCRSQIPTTLLAAALFQESLQPIFELTDKFITLNYYSTTFASNLGHYNGYVPPSTRSHLGLLLYRTCRVVPSGAVSAPSCHFHH